MGNSMMERPPLDTIYSEQELKDIEDENRENTMFPREPRATLKLKSSSSKKEVKKSDEKIRMPELKSFVGRSILTSEQVFAANKEVFDYFDQTQAKRDEIRRLLRQGLVFDPYADY